MTSTEYTAETSLSALIAAMPKAELHVHLDGCLRLQTIAELAAEEHLSLPVPAHRLSELCVAPDDCLDLAQVLAYFALPLSVLQTVPALERAAYELCEDASRENVRYIEMRFAPALHQQKGLTLEEIISAVVHGWDTGRRAFGLAGGLILCGMRNLPAADTLLVAQAGLPFLGRGVVGFDLAGDEAGFSVLLHRDPLFWAKDAGYGMTVHAGEAAGAQSVRDAVEVIGVSRVGHGVRSGEDPSLLDVLRAWVITLDMCPTSNLQTKSVSSLIAHPLTRYYRDGIRVTINTDNRTVSSTTMTQELMLTHEGMGLLLPDLAAVTMMALDAGFADAAERLRLQEEYQAEIAALGIEIARWR